MWIQGMVNSEYHSKPYCDIEIHSKIENVCYVWEREKKTNFFSYKPALNHNYLSFTVACSLFTNNINDFVCLSNCMIDRPTDRQTDRPYRLTDRTKERKVFSIPIFKTQQDFYRFKAI